MYGTVQCGTDSVGKTAQELAGPGWMQAGAGRAGWRCGAASQGEAAGGAAASSPLRAALLTAGARGAALAQVGVDHRLHQLSAGRKAEQAGAWT